MAVENQVSEASDRRRVPQIPSAPQVRTRRNPKWIALGVAAICLGAIASFFLYSQVAQSHQVVAVRHTIDRGQVITADDLGTVRVGDTGGLRTVPADQLGSLVGKIAAYDLVEGSLLPPGAATGTLPPARGKGVIGIKVATGRAPAGFLAPGSPVRLVILPPGTGSAEQAPMGGTAESSTTDPSDETAAESSGEVTNIATIAATVVTAERVDDGLVLNLELESGQAVDAAAYAAQDRVVVVRESER